MMILHEIVRALERIEERQREILERLDRDKERKAREENWGPRKAEWLCGDAPAISDARSATDGHAVLRTSDGASEPCCLRQGEGCRVREDEWLQSGIDNIMAFQAGKRKEE